MKCKFSAILAICLVVFPLSLLAQTEKSELPDTTQINEVVITGTKNAVSRNNVPYTVSVVNRAQIEESAESALLPVLSEQVPGVFITERGITGFGVSSGSAGSINIRGIGGSPNTDVLVLLNGNPQFMGIMGHPLPDAYIASDVEKVEVIRGPASTLYGSHAMGGVINIITKEQDKEGVIGNGQVMYGSYNTLKYMANAGYKKQRFNVYASFNHDHTDGQRDSSAFTINNGYLRVGYNFQPHLKADADFSLAHFIAQDPGPEGGIAGASIDITRGMGALSLTDRFDKTNGSLRFFYNFGEHSISDGFHSKDENFGVVLYQSVNLIPGNTLTFGIDYKVYGGMAENVKAMAGNGLVFVDTTEQELAGYVYMQQVLIDKVTANAGFRLEHSSVYGNEPVPTAGLAWHPYSGTTVKVSIAKGFRSPTIMELYMWGTANDNLMPERMVDYETGLTQQILKNRLFFELNFYKAKGDNMILTVTENGFTQYRNSGTFDNTGIEFSGTYRPFPNLLFRANYSYIHLAQPVLATPEHLLYSSGTYRLKNLTWVLSAQWVGNLITRISPGMKESYFLLNSRAAYRINRNFDFFVKGENLTHCKYYINYGYPMPGLVVFGGINLHY